MPPLSLTHLKYAVDDLADRGEVDARDQHVDPADLDRRARRLLAGAQAADALRRGRRCRRRRSRCRSSVRRWRTSASISAARHAGRERDTDFDLRRSHQFSPPFSLFVGTVTCPAVDTAGAAGASDLKKLVQCVPPREGCVGRGLGRSRHELCWRVPRACWRSQSEQGFDQRTVLRSATECQASMDACSSS